MKQAFHPAELYPEVAAISARFSVLRGEALESRAGMTLVSDRRVRAGDWRVLPLLPEEEDREVVTEDACRANRELVPETASILSAIPGLKALALSSLAAGGHIRPHRHANPFVTAALCLQAGGDSYLRVGGERRDYREGETIVFDYTLEHEVLNPGPAERIVLLVLLNNRLL